MKIQCGTDMIEINRVQKAIEELGEKFLQRIFTPKEIAYCESKRNVKYQHYAARFAAKEAVFKALSENIKDKYKICWTQIEVENDITGRPMVHIEKIKEIEGIQNIDISLSHSKEYAVAMVVVMFA